MNGAIEVSHNCWSCWGRCF